MLSSPVPIYLGCAGLIVGALGLSAHSMLGGNSFPASNAEPNQPLFARSVEEASLPASHWPTQQPSVAYYDPMVRLLTTPSRSVAPVPVIATPQAGLRQANPTPAAQPQAMESQQEPRAAPHEIARDMPRQTKTSKRSRSARTRDDAVTSREQVDGRDAYARVDRESRQLDPRQVDSERHEGSRRLDRRYGNRYDSEPIDARSRSDRQRVEVDERGQRERERRVIIREEPHPRIVRGPEQREGGFTPFSMFGAFGR
ncbi:MAG: hypothetical protein K2Y71_00615 [Xanthobacteraceae bacterium]|nr:hypothetical protein [Xanthobacteraceae bacterium]